MSLSVTINGEEKTLRELSEEYPIPYGTLKSRWYRGIRGESILQIQPRYKNRKHLMSHSVEYNTWRNIINRCRKDPIYVRRGIEVCDEWLNSFEQFYSDMGKRPEGDYSLDRINNDKGYSPTNCRWTTPKIQGNNRSDNVKLTYKGVTHSVEEWGELLSIKPHTIYKRVKKGKPINEVLDPILKPGQGKKPRKNKNTE